MNKSIKLVGLLLILGVMLPLAPLKGAAQDRVLDELKRRGSDAISYPLERVERDIGGRDIGLVGENERAVQEEYKWRIENATTEIQKLITELLEVNKQVEEARAATPKKRKRWSVRLPGRRRSSAADTEAVANLANLETQLGLLKRELNELNLKKVTLLKNAKEAIEAARAQDDQARRFDNIATVQATFDAYDWGTRDWDDNRDNWDNWLKSQATANPTAQGAEGFSFAALNRAVQQEKAKRASRSQSGSGSASPNEPQPASSMGEFGAAAASSEAVSTSTSTSSLPSENPDAETQHLRGSLRVNPSVARRVRSQRLPSVPGPPKPKS